jgi:hypothetical protein
MPSRLSKVSPSYLRPSRPIPKINYSPLCSTRSLIAASSRSHSFGKQKAFKLNRQFRRISNPPSQIGIERAKGGADSYEHVSKLKTSLIELQKQARSYVNISRLQLALRSLEQQPGEETVRVAILGLAGQDGISRTVRELVRLLVADPLREEEEWERILTAEETLDKPILLRVGGGTDDNTTHSEATNKLMRELNISSPMLNQSRLEILVLDADIDSGSTDKENLDEIILVPSVDIPTSNTGRYTPVRTPVHKAMIIGEGILGATSLLKLPVYADREIITSVVSLPGYTGEERQNLPFRLVNIGLAREALLKFRESLGNAISYEHDWFDSGLPELLDWLKAGTLDIADGDRMKTPIRSLVSSVLIDANRRIQLEESRQLSTLLASKVSSEVLQTLRGDLKTWAEHAHTELRDQLDIAFEGNRWSKLGWWKLFWRVDDVSMIASDMLNRRFLLDAEKEVIYLAGKIEEAGVPKSLHNIQQSNWAYKQVPKSPSKGIGSPPDDLYYEDIIERPGDDAVETITLRPWPLHIPVTRSYLSTDTVPALQALAQKLVLQTLTSSSFASLLSGLIYISSVSTSLYEAGAVAAVGVVWSLRRMQKKWETARTFWEGEVREEGRKAVRAVEVVVGEILKEAETARSTVTGVEELNQARDAIERASKALALATREVDK